MAEPAALTGCTEYGSACDLIYARRPLTVPLRIELSESPALVRPYDDSGA